MISKTTGLVISGALLIACGGACEPHRVPDSTLKLGVDSVDGGSTVGTAPRHDAASATDPDASPELLGARPAGGPTCTAPAIGDQEVRRIIEKARATRTDLPPAYPKSTWVVRRDGCHYTAIEWFVPPTPDMSHVFKLNQRGIIVDVTSGNSLNSDLQCADKILDEATLARIVAGARATRSDLPPPFPHSRTMVARMRCSYMYFEYRVPEARGDYQTFIIDSLGELMESSRSQPY